MTSAVQPVYDVVVVGFGAAGVTAAMTARAQGASVLVPLGFLALSCVLMALNPLGRGEHARIVRDLRK